MTSVDHVAGPTAADLGLVPPRWTRRVDPLARRLFPLAVVVGVAARVAISRRGSNYDFDSWSMVPDILRAGDLYTAPATVERYSTGPLWAYLLYVLDVAADMWSRPEATFRLLVVASLAVGDVAIALLLRRRYGSLVACAFVLNPISIVVSGSYNQRDNLGILGVMLAVALWDREPGPRPPWRALGGAAVMGLGLSMKHTMLLFPAWVAARRRDPLTRAVMFVVPFAVFAATFLPHVLSLDAAWGAVERAFLVPTKARPGLLKYGSWLGTGGAESVLALAVWLAATLGVGWSLRHGDHATLVSVYLLVSVAFAPGVAGQHLMLLAIPACVTMDPLLLVASALSTLFLLQNADGPRLELAWIDFFRLGGPANAWIQAVLWVWFARLGWRVWRVRRAGVGGRGRRARRAGVGSRARGVSGAGA